MLRSNYPYSLDKSSKKIICPNCGHRTFVRYVDNKTGQYLPGETGRCDREAKCRLHNKPLRAYIGKYTTPLRRTKRQIGNIDLIPVSEMQKTLTGYTQNILIQSLLQKFGRQEVNKALTRFYIGTGEGKHQGWTIFWQVDQNGLIRTGHMMKYLGLSRSKDQYAQNWVHGEIRKNFRLKQCFFGLDQIKGLSKDVTINIVESEKTAFIASIYYPDEIWLATASKNGLSKDKLLPLYQHSVRLYPDIDAFQSWSKIAKDMKNVNVINWPKVFIQNGVDRETLDETADLADYLLELDSIDFKFPSLQQESILTPTQRIQREEIFPKGDEQDFFDQILSIETPKQLDQETSELINFFSTVPLPKDPIRLSPAELICDSEKFVKSHIQFIKSQKGNPIFRPYLERLMNFRTILENQVIINR